MGPEQNRIDFVEDLDVGQLATYLRMNPDKVVKMATRGRLPGRRVGGQWRFSEAEIHHWLEERIGQSGSDELQQYARVVDRPAGRDAVSSPHIAELCPVSRIQCPLVSRTRGSVIRAMCETATQGGMMWDAVAMATAVENREAMHPTALDCGVALLHPRRPQTSILAESVLALGICPAPIPFSPDGQLVDVFFLICSYDDPFHLRILARLSRLITATELLSQLRASEDPATAHAAIVAAEAELPHA